MNAYQDARRLIPGCQHRMGCKCGTPYWLRPSTPEELRFEQHIERQFSDATTILSGLRETLSTGM